MKVAELTLLNISFVTRSLPFNCFLKMSSKKRSSDKHRTDESGSKKQKGEGDDLTEQEHFLSSVCAFILKASIEKMRLQIFENQLKKFGGSVAQALSPAVTHLIVDDKMDAERMCRILKLPTPPEEVEIVKSVWLSTCFKEKKLTDTGPYKLDCSFFIQHKSKSDCENATGTEAKTNSEINNTESSSEKLPKAGHLFSHKYKPAKVTVNDSDSDYNPSDGECKDHTDSNSDHETLVEVSPKKKLPVCKAKNILIKQCFYHHSGNGTSSC